MWKLYLKIHKAIKAIKPFCTNEWSYSTDNVQAMWDHLNKKDQQLFNFNMIEFDWTKYLIDHYMGIRLFLLDENDNTLEISRIKYKRFHWTHKIMKAVFIFIALWIFHVIFKKIFA
ncbi:fatty acyl-CoA reductase wat-like [Solenopsis invicta]|uniref:fatty acyl-CoA reductase wat-like n=1 Tax=Solenopsis invicta TaxID=13686 RepID=UPI000595BDCD|nr:fatty acyl-CoA reductase wat-like [Solenopsis invicta]